MRKFISVILGVIATILVAFTLFYVLSIDNEAPVITVVNPDIIYMEGSDEAILKEAVSAIDSKGGDVSDSIRIESTYVSEDKSTIKVGFVAKDSKNNISKLQVKFAYVSDPKPQQAPVSKNYNIVLINNLGVENLANSYAKVLQGKGHNIVSIGLSSDPQDKETVIYVAKEGDGQELLETFPNAKIYVGNIANRVNVDSTGADVFVILGWQHSILPLS